MPLIAPPCILAAVAVFAIGIVIYGFITEVRESQRQFYEASRQPPPRENWPPPTQDPFCLPRRRPRSSPRDPEDTSTRSGNSGVDKLNCSSEVSTDSYREKRKSSMNVSVNSPASTYDSSDVVLRGHPLNSSRGFGDSSTSSKMVDHSSKSPGTDSLREKRNSSKNGSNSSTLSYDSSDDSRSPLDPLNSSRGFGDSLTSSKKVGHSSKSRGTDSCREKRNSSRNESKSSTSSYDSSTSSNKSEHSSKSQGTYSHREKRNSSKNGYGCWDGSEIIIIHPSRSKGTFSHREKRNSSSSAFNSSVSSNCCSNEELRDALNVLRGYGDSSMSLGTDSRREKRNRSRNRSGCWNGSRIIYPSKSTSDSSISSRESRSFHIEHTEDNVRKRNINKPVKTQSRNNMPSQMLRQNMDERNYQKNVYEKPKNNSASKPEMITNMFDEDSDSESDLFEETHPNLFNLDASSQSVSSSDLDEKLSQSFKAKEELYKMIATWKNEVQKTHNSTGDSGSFNNTQNKKKDRIKDNMKHCICSGCEELPVDTVASPCGHRYLCSDCAKRILRIYNTCSICHTVIAKFDQSV